MGRRLTLLSCPISRPPPHSILGSAVAPPVRHPQVEEDEGRARTQAYCPFRETNMKVRQAIPVTSELSDISKLAKFDGE